MAKGSGRSVDGVNLVEILGGCTEGLTSWGGHPMAVGVSLLKVELERFRARFASAVREHPGSASPSRPCAFRVASPEQINEELMDELDALHPYGQGNPEPVFGLRGVVLRRRPEIFKERHFKFWIEDSRGRGLSGVAWKMAERVPPRRPARPGGRAQLEFLQRPAAPAARAYRLAQGVIGARQEAASGVGFEITSPM